MNFWSLSSKHLRHEFHMQYNLVFYAKLILWNIIQGVAESIQDVFSPLKVI